MNRCELLEKYADTLIGMSKAYPDDDYNVLLDKLIYENDVKHGRRERIDTYKVPEGFDFEAFEKDYQEIIGA